MNPIEFLTLTALITSLTFHRRIISNTSSFLLSWAFNAHVSESHTTVSIAILSPKHLTSFTPFLTLPTHSRLLYIRVMLFPDHQHYTLISINHQDWFYDTPFRVLSVLPPTMPQQHCASLTVISLTPIGFPLFTSFFNLHSIPLRQYQVTFYHLLQFSIKIFSLNND